jgi:hypothetical protein
VNQGELAHARAIVGERAEEVATMTAEYEEYDVDQEEREVRCLFCLFP